MQRGNGDITLADSPDIRPLIHLLVDCLPDQHIVAAFAVVPFLDGVNMAFVGQTCDLHALNLRQRKTGEIDVEEEVAGDPGFADASRERGDKPRNIV
jgi:hypothetical protein